MEINIKTVTRVEEEAAEKFYRIKMGVLIGGGRRKVRLKGRLRIFAGPNAPGAARKKNLSATPADIPNQTWGRGLVGTGSRLPSAKGDDLFSQDQVL